MDEPLGDATAPTSTVNPAPSYLKLPYRVAVATRSETTQPENLSDLRLACTRWCSVHQAPWDELVPLAWHVDPTLALALRAHFPTVEGVRHHLESMVLKNATQPMVSVLSFSLLPGLAWSTKSWFFLQGVGLLSATGVLSIASWLCLPSVEGVRHHVGSMVLKSATQAR